MTTQKIPHGRVQTLTAEQEWELKEVWAHFLRYLGTPVNLPTEDAPKRSTTSTSASSASKPSSSHHHHHKEKQQKSKFMSKFRRGNKESKHDALDQLSTVSTRSTESIESNYPHKIIHDSLKDLQPEQIFDTFWDMLRVDLPDNLILRFLRARKWDSDKALAMLAHCIHWRLKESEVDTVFFEGEKALIDEGHEGFHLQLKLSKAYFRGYDNDGRPIVHIRPRLHHASDQTEEEVKKYALLIIEEARLMLKEPVDSASIIFDLTGFSMANMDYAPVKFMIGVFEAYYPESLGKLLIHKAPWIFPPIWNIIKNWLDPVVASKVSFTKSGKDLAKHIPEKYIPKDLGGKDEFQMEYIEPVEGEDALRNDEVTKQKIKDERKEIIKRFIEATVKWIEAPTVEDSKKALQEKIYIGQELIRNYIKLDPYVRRRCVFDRNGTLKLEA